MQGYVLSAEVETGLLQGMALVYIGALILAAVDESSRLEDTESREERVGVLETTLDFVVLQSHTDFEFHFSQHQLRRLSQIRTRDYYRRPLEFIGDRLNFQKFRIGLGIHLSA